jgi:hypothetical protein
MSIVLLSHPSSLFENRPKSSSATFEFEDSFWALPRTPHDAVTASRMVER